MVSLIDVTFYLKKNFILFSCWINTFLSKVPYPKSQG